uniref:uncharacterized protein LOC120325877 isoform X2 n=1 Tax=Styela clava TaxID=7725 RepID=UPI00193ADEB7|nr:uncharacterized protein LOC120325877 isoform X2 [Styela clava]
MVISASASVVFLGFIVFVLVQDGSDFIKDNLAKCIAGLCGVILAIICAAILLSKCKSCEHWTGGDIACVVLGSIGTIDIVICCMILMPKWFKKDYSRGTSS